MKRLFLLLLLLTSCTKEELENFEWGFRYGNSSKKEEVLDSVVNATYQYTPQQIYKNSTQNHELNDGYFNELTMKWEYAFRPAFTYVDFDKDGDMDIFAKVEDYIKDGDIQWNSLYVLENLGNNQWKNNFDLIPEQKGVFYRRLKAADIDNDGDIDIVGFVAQEPAFGDYYPNIGGVDLFRFEDGIFKYENIVPYEENIDIWFHGGALADVNNDGWVDIIGSSTTPRIYLNRGGGVFYPNEYFDIGKKWGDGGTSWGGVHIWNLDFADLNNDGLLDMIGGLAKNEDFFFDFEGNDMEEFQKTTEIYYNTGTYPFYDVEPYYLGTDYYTDKIEDSFPTSNDVAIIDYNGDGYLDIFTAESKAWKFSRDGVFQYHQNNGDGTFSVRNDVFKYGDNELFESFEGGQIWDIKAFDINNDGNSELLIENWKYAGFNIWHQNSEGKLTRGVY